MIQTNIAKNTTASAVMASSKSDDQKLFEVFQLYQDEIRTHNSQLYYALLGWADRHRRELELPVSELPDYFK
jgi:hypothetical protein